MDHLSLRQPLFFIQSLLPPFLGSFWFEMLPGMRGASASIPGFAGKNPFNFGFGVYKNNVAHSALAGIRTYPHGTNYGYGLRGARLVSFPLGEGT